MPGEIKVGDRVRVIADPSDEGTVTGVKRTIFVDFHEGDGVVWEYEPDDLTVLSPPPSGPVPGAPRLIDADELIEWLESKIAGLTDAFNNFHSARSEVFCDAYDAVTAHVEQMAAAGREEAEKS